MLWGAAALTGVGGYRLERENAGLDTFPKHLIANARRFGARAAMRHKDYGIWQSWTWAEQLEEVRSFSVALTLAGLKAGDKVAIVGSNRPRLYWSFCAVQAAGGVPVPVYADSVAEEMAYVLDHAGVRFAVVEDQEQVDKLLSVSEQVPSLTEIIYDEPRGLGDYDHTRLHSFAEMQDKGRAAMAADASVEKAWFHSWLNCVSEVTWPLLMASTARFQDSCTVGLESQIISPSASVYFAPVTPIAARKRPAAESVHFASPGVFAMNSSPTFT